MTTDKALEEAASEHRMVLAVVDKDEAAILDKREISFIAGANYREQNPRWKYPEVDGWPSSDALSSLFVIEYEDGSFCTGRWVVVPDDLHDLRPCKRWLLIEGSK